MLRHKIRKSPCRPDAREPLRPRILGRLRTCALLTFLITLAPLLVCPAGAQTEEESADSQKVESTIEAVKAQVERLAGAEGGDDEQRKNLLDTYRRALTELQQAKQNTEAARNYQQEATKVSERIEKLRSELEQLPDQAVVQIPPDAELSQLEQRLHEAEAELANARKTTTELQEESKHRSERRVEIPRLIAESREKLQQVKQELSTPAPEGTSEPVAAARQTLLEARQKALETRIESLEHELTSYDARKQLLPVRIDLAARKADLARQRVERLKKAVSERRKEEAKKAAEEAARTRREAARAHPLLKNIAEENQQLANRRVGPNGLTSRIEAANKRLEEVSSLRDEMEQEYQSVKEKVDAVGLNEAVGILLLKKRGDLPRIPLHRREIQRRQEKISSVQFEMLELEEERREFTTVEGRLNNLKEQLPETTESQRREELLAEARALLETRRKLTNSLISDYDTLFGALVDLDSSQRQLVQTASRFSSYIDRHVLWVQSDPALSLETPRKGLNGLRWMLSPANWKELVNATWNDLRRNPLPYLTFVLSLTVLVLLRGRLRKRLDEIADHLHSSETDRIALTGWGLVLTVLLAIPGPLVLVFFGWRLGLPRMGTSFGAAIGNGLRAAGGYWLVLALLTAVCRQNGLADAHFRLREEGIAFLRRHLHWFVAVVVPAVFLLQTFQWQPTEAWTESIGRVAYMAALGSLAIFFAITLRPNGQLIQTLLRRSRGSYIERCRYIWYFIAVALPTTLVIASATGYYYSALRLADRLHWTILVVLVIMFLHYLTVRWLLLVRRRLAAERVKEKRAEQQAQSAEESDDTQGEKETRQEEPEEDLFALSMQTRRFLRAFLGVTFLGGLWIIWSEVFPALTILQRIKLWSVSAGTGAEADVLQISLAGAILALIIVVLAIVAARNIPGLMEIGILQHLPLDRGVRFAIRTLSRYSLVVVGVVLAANQLGFGWAKVQWLVAAMTVGLGFGLQEIFGNFVSGLIILFERPMRVGDTVTVGDIFGTVTQIRIRATTIQQWDRKELIVPNKEFITGRLINWTLSDTVLRMEFPVGIAYGSDTDLAEKRLYEVAHSADNVLDDPAPRVVFKGFGDNSLQFELRVFIDDIENYVPTWHDINREICRTFRESELVIAFPQRDVHLNLAQDDIPVSLRKSLEEGKAEPEHDENEPEGNEKDKDEAESK